MHLPAEGYTSSTRLTTIVNPARKILHAVCGQREYSKVVADVPLYSQILPVSSILLLRLEIHFEPVQSRVPIKDNSSGYPMQNHL